MEQSPKKILVIDDDQAIRDLYKEILTTEGFAVDTMKDGQEGYFAILNGGYDLILLDILIPKMDGIAILEKLQSEKPQKPNGPILILSNLGQETFTEKGLTLGAKECLTKSNYTPDQILAKVKKYLS